MVQLRSRKDYKTLQNINWNSQLLKIKCKLLKQFLQQSPFQTKHSAKI